jgi:hypothetical protein
MTTSSGGATGTGTGGRGGAQGSGSGGRTGGTGSGGRASTGGVGGSAAGGRVGTGGSGTAGVGRFSFFVTSLESMRLLSKSQDGFGGDLRFGEATGLAGADKICASIAETAMPGAGSKTWRAFLSAFGPPAVNAIDRVGTGPWYDRLGRLVAMNKTGLAMTRPGGGDAAVAADLPNETGTPNHQGVDNHDTLTASTAAGLLSAANAGATCNDWTSAVGTTGKPIAGHSWPAGSGTSWIQAHGVGGCAAGVNLVQSGGPGSMTTVGAGGGYGGFYCFALTP